MGIITTNSMTLLSTLKIRITVNQRTQQTIYPEREDVKICLKVIFNIQLLKKWMKLKKRRKEKETVDSLKPPIKIHSLKNPIMITQSVEE